MSERYHVWLALSRGWCLGPVDSELSSHRQGGVRLGGGCSIALDPAGSDSLRWGRSKPGAEWLSISMSRNGQGESLRVGPCDSLAELSRVISGVVLAEGNSASRWTVSPGLVRSVSFLVVTQSLSRSTALAGPVELRIAESAVCASWTWSDRAKRMLTQVYLSVMKASL